MTKKKGHKTVSQAEIKKMVALRKEGKSIEKIAEILNRDKRTVEKYITLAGFKEIQMSEQQLKHIDRVTEQADMMRSCLEDPHIENLPDSRDLLEFRGDDWRLFPSVWFYLSTPDFREIYLWGHDFYLLKSHMKESPFLKHLRKLQRQVLALGKQYQSIAESLVITDEGFKSQWESIQKIQVMLQEEVKTTTGRAPNNTLNHWGNIKPPFDKEYTEKIMRKFQSVQSDIQVRQADLESLLDQLNADLSENEISNIIYYGRCHRCLFP
jgi:hypothetical protein